MICSKLTILLKNNKCYNWSNLKHIIKNIINLFSLRKSRLAICYRNGWRTSLRKKKHSNCIKKSSRLGLCILSHGELRPLKPKIHFLGVPLGTATNFTSFGTRNDFGASLPSMLSLGEHIGGRTMVKSDFVSDTKAGEKRIFNNLEYDPEGFYRAMRKYESPSKVPGWIQSELPGTDCFSLNRRLDARFKNHPKVLARRFQKTV